MMDIGGIVAIALGVCGVVYFVWDALTYQRRGRKDKR